MEIIEATGRILEAGKSPELTALLASVAEATTADGEPRYAPRVYRDMARAVVCRTYAKPVLELCHLINAADACGAGGDRWESFFYGVDSARPSAFQGYVEMALEDGGWRRPGVEASSDGLTLIYADAVFNVRYGRIPFLAALLEAALMMVGYREMDGVFRGMLAQPGDENAVSDAANALNRLIYGYLKEHLPSGHSAEKFEAILDFLKSVGGGPGGGVEIDDQTILRFWQRNSGREEDGLRDFRTFRSVAGAFVDFVHALGSAEERHQMTHARSIGTDREAGEIDPGLLEDGDDPGDTSGVWQSPLDVLDDPPADAVKFLTKKERENLDELMAYGPLSRELPATVLRSEVFGYTQSRITQALRAKAGGNTLTGLLACTEAESYAERTARYRQSAERLHQVQKATLHALSFAPLSDDEEEEAGETNVVSLFAGRMDAAQEAREAFKGVNRRGFQEADLDDDHIREAFGVGAGALVQIAGHLNRYLETLDGMDEISGELEACFETDRTVFAAEFARLYGERL